MPHRHLCRHNQLAIDLEDPYLPGQGILGVRGKVLVMVGLQELPHARHREFYLTLMHLLLPKDGSSRNDDGTSRENF